MRTLSAQSKTAGTYEGLTLIETILYLALFAIIFFTVMQFVLALSENNRRAMARSRVEQSQIFVLEHLQESFDRTDTINGVATVFENDAGVLSLSFESGSCQYSLVTGRIMYENGGVSVPLTAPDVVVTKFYLEEVNNAASALVGVRLTLVITTEENEAVETIETTYAL